MNFTKRMQVENAVRTRIVNSGKTLKDYYETQTGKRELELWDKEQKTGRIPRTKRIRA